MILPYLVIRSTTVDQLSIFVKTISKHFLKEWYRAVGFWPLRKSPTAAFIFPILDIQFNYLMTSSVGILGVSCLLATTQHTSKEANFCQGQPASAAHFIRLWARTTPTSEFDNNLLSAWTTREPSWTSGLQWTPTLEDKWNPGKFQRQTRKD